MSKTMKVAILLVLSLICAALAALGVYMYLKGQKAFIYVFNDNYSAGTKITKDMFTSLKVDDQIILAGQKGGLATYYITGENFEKTLAGNEYLLNDVVKNQPLTFTDLALTSSTAIERKLDGNTYAVTIPISGTAAVTNKLRVGSIVNIYKTDATETRLLFENMRIEATNSDKEISTVTFITGPDDTINLINASNNYKLYFALTTPVSDKNAHSGYVASTQPLTTTKAPAETTPAASDSAVNDEMPNE